METYKINITRSEASERAKSAWLTRKKNGNTKWGRPFIKGQKSWNTNLTSSIDSRVCRGSKRMKRTIRKQFNTGERLPYIHTTETNTKMSIAKLGDKNPMRIYPELRENQRKVVIKVFKKMNWKATLIEKKLWEELTKLDIKFKKNYHLGWHTIPDAYIPEGRIAIYADGDYWHNLPNWKERDIRVNKWLNENGYRIVRFWEHEIHSINFSQMLKNKI